jgi:hypothetical protein
MPSRLLLTSVVLALLAACGGGETVDTTTPTTVPATTTTAPGSTAPTTTVPAPTVIDWDDRSTNVALPDGWTVTYCEGQAPFLCVAKDGDVVGVVEIFIADPLTYDAYDPAADDETNLRAIAAAFVDAFRDDRAAGCGSDYLLERIDPQLMDLGGVTGLVYGFRGTLGDGSPSELNLQYASLSHGRLVLLVAAAYDEGGCPGKDDMISFDSADLDEFGPRFLSLLESAPFDGGSEDTGYSLPDGDNFAWILADRDGVFVVDPARVLTGEEARRQAVADGVIPEGEDLPNDVYLWNPTEEQMPVRFSADATFTVIAPGADGGLASRETDRETIVSILAGGDTGDIYGLTPEFMPFSLLVIGGEVIEMNQIYLP